MDKPRLMRLTSDYTEIILFSAKVPGYWATQLIDKEKFFLYTLAGAYRKGDTLKVAGTFGNAYAAVFDDETRVYQGAYRTNVFIVWDAVKSGTNDKPQPSGTV